jgi:hypothetical protein
MLSASRQGLCVLAHLRRGDTDTQLVAGFGIGIGTVYRYVREAVGLLAARAPSLAEVLATARRSVWLILDGSLLSHRRGSALVAAVLTLELRAH